MQGVHCSAPCRSIYTSAEKSLWPGLGVLDAFFKHSSADSELTSLRAWRRTDVYRNIWTNWGHRVGYPLQVLSGEDKAQLIEQFNVRINMAQDMILKFLTPALEEPYRLRLVLEGFWKRHGFPWDYCDKGKSEGGLFSLIANQDLTEFKKDLCHFQKSADA